MCNRTIYRFHWRFVQITAVSVHLYGSTTRIWWTSMKVVPIRWRSDNLIFVLSHLFISRRSAPFNLAETQPSVITSRDHKLDRKRSSKRPRNSTTLKKSASGKGAEYRNLMKLHNNCPPSRYFVKNSDKSDAALIRVSKWEQALKWNFAILRVRKWLKFQPQYGPAANNYKHPCGIK